MFCCLNSAIRSRARTTRVPRRWASSLRNPAESAASCLRVSTFSHRYSVVSSFATCAAMTGERLSKLTENAIVALVGAALARVDDVGADHVEA